MLDTFKDMIKSFFQSRILPVAVVFILLFAILVNRLFSLQIADTDTYASQAAKRTEKTKSIKATRGKNSMTVTESFLLIINCLIILFLRKMIRQQI